MDEQLELEPTSSRDGGHGDFVEGVTAFVQKRPARFGGA